MSDADRLEREIYDKALRLAALRAAEVPAEVPDYTFATLDGDAIVRRATAHFGPGDLYSPVWHFLALAGIAADAWTPQFGYWRRPQRLDDGGKDVRE